MLFRSGCVRGDELRGRMRERPKYGVRDGTGEKSAGQRDEPITCGNCRMMSNGQTGMAYIIENLTPREMQQCDQSFAKFLNSVQEA